MRFACKTMAFGRVSVAVFSFVKFTFIIIELLYQLSYSLIFSKPVSGLCRFLLGI